MQERHPSLYHYCIPPVEEVRAGFRTWLRKHPDVFGDRTLCVCVCVCVVQ